MEWVYAGLVILGCLSLGVLTAVLTILWGEKMKSSAGKISVMIFAAVLPALLLSAVWLNHGISICSYCDSITVNTYTADNWIIEVPICRNCVEYVNVCKECEEDSDRKTANQLKEPEKGTHVQQVCINCEGHLNMRDDEFGEMLIKLFLIFWALGHWGTLIVMFLIWLGTKIKKKVRG